MALEDSEPSRTDLLSRFSAWRARLLAALRPSAGQAQWEDKAVTWAFGAIVAVGVIGLLALLVAAVLACFWAVLRLGRLLLTALALGDVLVVLLLCYIALQLAAIRRALEERRTDS